MRGLGEVQVPRLGKVYDSYPSWTAEHIAAATGADTWSGPAKGMITGQKRTTLNASGSFTEAYATTVWLYDALGRQSSRTCSVSGGVTLSSTDSYNLRQLMTSHVVKRGTSSLYTETLGYDGTATSTDQSVERK